MNQLNILGISKTYPNGIKALNQISLTLHNGIFGLLGPNGAGKSSLMRSIATLQSPDNGQIQFNGTNILQKPQFIRQQLGYLPQDFGVYPGISAYRLLDHLALLKGLTDKQSRQTQIEALLHKTNLHTRRRQAVSTFSGGMRQRFGIAQALLGNPQLIIVDEPTAGLDPEERHRFLDLLCEVGEERIVLLSTHIVEDVRDRCQRLAIMHQGKLVRQGIPQELIAELSGQVWEGQMDKETPIESSEKTRLLSARLIAGKRRVRFWSTHSPGANFTKVQPQLEDVYFATFFN
ncbi:MAG: ABC transporter ATP-binding protein [Bacteroidota bacterium]